MDVARERTLGPVTRLLAAGAGARVLASVAAAGRPPAPLTFAADREIPGAGGAAHPGRASVFAPEPAAREREDERASEDGAREAPLPVTARHETIRSEIELAVEHQPAVTLQQ